MVYKYIWMSIISASFIFAGACLLYSCKTGTNTVEPVAVVSFSDSVSENRNKITAPPATLNLDVFYKKYLNVLGIPIVGSEKVSDDVFFAVQKMIRKMMSMRNDVLAKMVENKIRVAIIGSTEITIDIPEYRNWNKEDTTIDWNERGRGYGATVELPLTTCAEENVLCYGQGKDGWFNEDIFIHEFAHSIHGLGILFIDKNFDTELQEALDNAKVNGLWENTYAASNISEYFAEGVQDWFNVNAEAIPGDGIHNEINNHEELKEYDPVLYNIIKRYFKKDDKKISCHQ